MDIGGTIKSTHTYVQYSIVFTIPTIVFSGNA